MTTASVNTPTKPVLGNGNLDLEIDRWAEPDGKLYAVSVNVASGQTDEPQLTADDAEKIAHLLRAS